MNQDLVLTVISVRQEVQLRGGGAITNTLVMSLPNGALVEAIITEETLTRIVGAGEEPAPEPAFPGLAGEVDVQKEHQTMAARRFEQEEQLGQAQDAVFIAAVDDGVDHNAVFDESGVAQG